jgi:Ca2+-binding RTX toxin-like protein
MGAKQTGGVPRSEEGSAGEAAYDLLAAAMMVAVVCGVALAQTLTGNDRDNRLIGSNHRDQISGEGGEDLIRGLRHADVLSGGEDGDTINAGPRDESAIDVVAAGDGDDFVRVLNRPAARDVVDCGEGFDRVVADRRDILSRAATV